jgi:hypothetical protein
MGTANEEVTEMEATTATGQTRIGRVALGQRLAAACGALFSLGILVGDDTINGAGEAAGPDSSIAEVNEYLRDAGDAAASGSYWVGRGIGTLAFVALLIFSVYVARQIRRREPGDGLLSGTVLAAGIAVVALGLVSAIAQFAAVIRADDAIDPQVARALLDFSGIAFILTWLPLAVFLGAVAGAGTRLAILPRWLSIGAGVLAAGLLAGLVAQPADAAFIAITLTFLWFIAASVALVRRAGGEHV